MIVIPAIDLKDGQCVRLKQGLMDQSTVFSDSPLDVATQWVKQGAKRLHIVDLNGAFAGTPINHQAVQDITREHPNLRIQIGGGIRDLPTIERYLDSGLSWVIIGTQAVKQPELVSEACKEFPGKIIVGLDAKQGLVATEGWAELSNIKATELAKRFEQDGVSSIVYTDIARDGMMQGVNIDETRAMANASTTPVIASGGVTNMQDIEALLEVSNQGIMGAIAGRAIYEGGLDLKQAQQLCDRSAGNL